MDRGRVGEDRGSKETDGCPLTVIPIVSETHSVSFGYASLVGYSYYIPRQY
jgi:hypothetical protein